MQPPWIFFLLILTTVSAAEDVTSSTTQTVNDDTYRNASLVRPNRGTEREQQYPTYYLAHSYTDEAGERRNVLIPVQAGQPATSPTTPQPPTTPDYHQFSPSPQITPNGLPATSNPAITHAMLVNLQNVVPSQSIPTRPPDYPSGAFIYTYRKPSKNYASPQRPIKANGYIGPKLQYKTQPTKLYNLDVGHRFRPRGRPDKNKYTATKLQFSLQSTPSPYYNKVRFELTDAMIPAGPSIALQPVPSTPKTVTEGTTLSGLSQYLEQEKTKFYYPQKHQIQYIPLQQQQQQPLPSSEPQYDVQSPTARPEIHYTPSTPSPSSRPATLQQHYEDSRQTYYPETKPTPQIEYVPVTDIETAPRPTPQQYQYEENRATQRPHLQYIIETENARPSPRPQVHYASDNGDLRASAQPQLDYEQPSPRPQIHYPSESSVLRGSTHYTQDTNEVTPTPQYEPEAVRATPQEPIQYDHENNDVTTPQPQYQYVTEDAAPAPPVELTYAPPKFPPAVQEAYNILKQTNQLPASITPDNIDGSIKTLALILQRLQQQEKTPKHPTKPKAIYQHPSKEQTYPSGGSTPGRPGIDYPTYASIPKTSFDCTTQRYKGFFGDPETSCQVWHYCDLNGGQASFLCPNGTIFNQVALTCDWWFNVRCSSTSQLYVLNERLYKYILPFSPSFPEDYSGPVVDRYLAAKFKEQEAKNKLKALKALITTPAPEVSSTETTTEASIN